MKYFTPELITRGKTENDATLDAVELQWDEAGERYRNYYQSIESELPPGMQKLQSSYYLHDAKILSMGRQKDSFLIVLRLDTPPRDLLVFTYILAGEPIINREALPVEVRSHGETEWLYDEVELLPENPTYCLHSILLSNGWEVQLPIRDVYINQMQPLFPVSQPTLAVAPLG